MSVLDSLLRGSRGFRRPGKFYRPFSQPPYRGGYPFKAPRGTSATPNRYNLGVSTSKHLLLRAPTNRPLYLYEDRRLWHPLGENAFPRSLRQAYPRVVDYTPMTPNWPVDPYDPYHPQRSPFGPRSPRPFGPSQLPIPKGHDYFVGSNPNGYLDITRASPVSWEHPYDMLICLKRRMRREIMHALGLAGKTGFKKPTYTQFSYVKCR